ASRAADAKEGSASAAATVANGNGNGGAAAQPALPAPALDAIAAAGLLIGWLDWLVFAQQSVLVCAVAAVTSVIQSDAHSQLYFDFHYLTDEVRIGSFVAPRSRTQRVLRVQLVFYGLKGYVGHFVFQLANLLYSFVFELAA